ncbi:alpha/beta fold hydrolase [Yinghuangia seranimata]|uniref:alpha/beta fold hydrolase n=1 Tax=Yinghuangia seranimata TaxID=408067 RepID=UPI00248D34B1|nr:alpha/beta fold hydrolase [Yinghuangia seranimata]MDI2127020.1 alpha/beta fold hydrolase [Yinghuangia seranimata]
MLRQRQGTSPEPVAGGADERLVMYVTTGTDGRPVAATGIVTVPKSPPPEGGWPVVAWDHGTTGIAAECAPSRGFGPSSQGAGDMLAAFVQRGFAVVQPDYVGMGVTGVKHPYLDGRSAAYATLDLVRAAHNAFPDVGTTAFVVGHSQGGHAALWTSHYAPQYAADIDVRGVVAIAPANGFQLMPQLVAARDSTAEPYAGIFLLVVDGASATTPTVVPERILTPAGLKAAERAWHACAFDAPADQLPPVADLLRPDADLAPLVSALAAAAPDQVALNAPVFLPQGGQDPLGALNLPLTQTLCGKGASVEFKVYPDEQHTPAEVHAAGDDAVAWVQARLDGTPVTGACGF